MCQDYDELKPVHLTSNKQTTETLRPPGGPFGDAWLEAVGGDAPLRGRWAWWPRRRTRRQHRRWRWCQGGASDRASACRGPRSCTWRRCLRARGRSRDSQDPLGDRQIPLQPRKPPPFRPWRIGRPQSVWRPPTWQPPRHIFWADPTNSPSQPLQGSS